jgi:adenylate cyclase
MGEKQNKRRLAAILVADVAGYTKMMAADETGTLEALQRHREAVFNPAVSEHEGRLVKLTGDGALVEFPSVVDAVNCALAIQRSTIRENNASGCSITLRIGINLGDVIIDGDDIYGDGVNVAARLEPLADPGGVCVASIVKESIGSRIDISLSDGGEVSVKNVERPIRIWRWHPQNERPANGSAAITPAAPKTESRAPSIAVLPFDNMSGDPEQEYFSDGMAEDIITDLSKVGGLIVIARNSSFVYKGKRVDLRTVGRELGVGAVLEGSIRRAGNRVRITAQLIDAANGAHLWAERYDRDLTDIFEVQDDVTKRIVDALKVKLTPGEQERLATNGAMNIDAHDLFLRAREIVSGAINREGFENAQSLLERAVALEPAYSNAHACLAMANVFAYQNAWTHDRATALAKADECAQKACRLSPDDPEALHALAIVKMMQKDVAACRAAVEKGIALYPNNQQLVRSRGTLNIYSGNPEAAIPDIERAMRLDPGQDHRNLQFLGIAHLLLGNYELAATIFRQRIRIVPDTDIGRAMLVSALGHLGESGEAKRIWDELIVLKPDYSVTAHISNTYNNPEDARSVIEGFEKAGLPV